MAYWRLFSAVSNCFFRVALILLTISILPRDSFKDALFLMLYMAKNRTPVRDKRYIIETINDMLKNTAQIVHSRHRSVSNFIMNLISALGAYCFFDNKPKALQGYCIEDTKQLSLF